MRKCAKCGKVMMSDLRLKVNGGGYGIVVHVDEKQKAKIIDDVKVAVCGVRPTASKRNGRPTITPSARQKERRKKLLSRPKIWQRAFIPPSASYPIRSRNGPHYRPAPPFNKYHAKENRHERIDLYPLRRLLHPRSEIIGAAGGPHR